VYYLSSFMLIVHYCSYLSRYNTGFVIRRPGGRHTPEVSNWIKIDLKWKNMCININVLVEYKYRVDIP